MYTILASTRGDGRSWVGQHFRVLRTDARVVCVQDAPHPADPDFRHLTVAPLTTLESRAHTVPQLVTAHV